MEKYLKNVNSPFYLIRAGLVFVFLYAAVSTLMHPLEWVGFLPSVITNNFNAITFVKLLAIYEIVLVVWLVSGKYLKYTALIVSLTLIGIIITNLNQLIVTFRDVGLLFAALALFVHENNK